MSKGIPKLEIEACGWREPITEGASIACPYPRLIVQIEVGPNKGWRSIGSLRPKDFELDVFGFIERHKSALAPPFNWTKEVAMGKPANEAPASPKTTPEAK